MRAADISKIEYQFAGKSNDDDWLIYVAKAKPQLNRNMDTTLHVKMTLKSPDSTTPPKIIEYSVPVKVELSEKAGFNDLDISSRLLKFFTIFN